MVHLVIRVPWNHRFDAVEVGEHALVHAIFLPINSPQTLEPQSSIKDSELCARDVFIREAEIGIFVDLINLYRRAAIPRGSCLPLTLAGEDDRRQHEYLQRPLLLGFENTQRTLPLDGCTWRGIIFNQIIQSLIDLRLRKIVVS